jgi:hypothetical protein
VLAGSFLLLNSLNVAPSSLFDPSFPALNEYISTRIRRISSIKKYGVWKGKRGTGYFIAALTGFQRN